MTHDKYIIELARSEHLDMLPEIELAAAALFPNDVITSEIRASIVPREQLIVAQMEDRLWVAVTSRGTPVGFAIALPEYNCAFLHEIDVHPAHQRRGLGRRLIQEVVNWAQAKKFACVSLTTFEHVPWNAPFYSRLGFRKLAEHELSRELVGRLQLERQRGLRQRIAMQLELDPKQPNNPIHATCEDARA